MYIGKENQTMQQQNSGKLVSQSANTVLKEEGRLNKIIQTLDKRTEEAEFAIAGIISKLDRIHSYPAEPETAGQLQNPPLYDLLTELDHKLARVYLVFNHLQSVSKHLSEII